MRLQIKALWELPWERSWTGAFLARIAKNAPVSTMLHDCFQRPQVNSLVN
jgi:hypothetical protein